MEWGGGGGGGGGGGRGTTYSPQPTGLEYTLYAEGQVESWHPQPKPNQVATYGVCMARFNPG